MLVWVLRWSDMTLTFDGIIVRGILQQLQSRVYERTAGLVTKSGVDVHSDSDGVSYRIDLEYSYEVDGVGYQNDRYRYGFEMFGRRDVRQIVARHSVDSMVDVFYDPAEPQDTLFALEISWIDFFTPLLMLPFNLIMVAVFSYAVVAPIGN